MECTLGLNPTGPICGIEIEIWNILFTEDIFDAGIPNGLDGNAPSTRSWLGTELAENMASFLKANRGRNERIIQESRINEDIKL